MLDEPFSRLNKCSTLSSIFHHFFLSKQFAILTNLWYDEPRITARVYNFHPWQGPAVINMTNTTHT